MKVYDIILKTFLKLDVPRIKQFGKLENKDFTINRKMPFKDIIIYVLSQNGKTLTISLI